MTVQLTNCRLGVALVEPAGVDAHGSPLPGVPVAPEALLPGKRTELDTGQWQLALDPACWPVRTGDVVVAHDGAGYLATYCKLLRSPALEPEELAGEDMDVSFIRVMANEITADGTEPVGSEFVGR